MFFRGIRRGLKSALHEPGWGASIGALFGVLFIIQVLILFTLGIHSAMALLRDRTDVRLEIRDEATLTQIADLRNSLAIEPYVEEVVFISSEDAFEKERIRDPELITFLEKFGIKNPFPNTMGVRLKHLEDYKLLRQFLNRPEYSNTVDSNFLSQSTDQEDQIHKLIAATLAIRSFLIVTVVLITLVLLFVIIELVGRRALLRSEEILVQTLVGATPITILTPFCTEVLLLMSIALLLAGILLGGVLYSLPFFLPSFAETGLFAPWVRMFQYMLFVVGPWIAIGEVIVLPLLALLGSFLGLWTRLKKPTLSSL
jgi:cell division transport system permease protein